MGKREQERQAVEDILANYLVAGNAEPLWQHLMARSNLPGRRANIELAQAFGDAVALAAAAHAASLWALCQEMVSVDSVTAPVNDPREFIPFCGALGVGALGSVDPAYAARGLEMLHMLANDSRWRVREAVCFALQRLLAHGPDRCLHALKQWAEAGSWLEMRAAVAAVAEPELLRDERLAQAALELHRTAFVRIQSPLAPARDDAFRTLRQALGYTLSVVTVAAPAAGFALLDSLAQSSDNDLRWIARNNLQKKRLRRAFPDQIAAIEETLASG